MILAHYSAKPISTFDMSVHDKEFRALKPNGMWVSDDTAETNWQDWCVGESFGLDRFKFRTEVVLKPIHNVLTIKTAEEIDGLHSQYGYDPFGFRELPHHSLLKRDKLDYIDWEKIIKKYDGIIITPYIWERRLDGPMWYYAWDCASGCIWNKDAIELKPSEPFDIDAYAKRKQSEAA